MKVVAPIVEGDGEVAALPVLLRRINEWLSPGVAMVISPPIRVRRDRFLNRDEEFRRHLLLAAAKARADGWVLIVLDADDDCPANAAPDSLRRARTVLGDLAVTVSVVYPNREYEAWFIAAAESLDGCRGFTWVPGVLPDPEGVRDAKGWIQERMLGSYRPVSDQPAFSQRFDLQSAHERSRSFRKLCDDWRRFTMIAALDS